ncbi:MAG: major capsid protein [Oscillospiraceae bacterium]|nr:major capsid protein [Oscillospiraceae bacterium]
MNRSTNQGIQASIAKGWKPNAYLTNMSMAFFQNPADFVATSIFPICPVPLSASYFYTFSKADLARDNVQRKPAFGHVNPAIMGQEDNSYKCQVDQVLVGIDQIAQLNYQRSNAPGVADPRRAKVRFATEQMLLHQDILFASKFFKAAAWGNVKTGKSTTPGTNEFWKWDNSSSDPIGQIDDLKAEIKRNGRRTPNRLALGVDAYIALKNHPDIIDRIKYTGTTANPARVTPQVLAELFGVEQVKVLESTYNTAGIGQAAAMDFICDSKAALLCYATPTPQIDEPSAGYIFTWDMLGNGQPVAFDQFEGTPADHSEFIEGLMSTDMKKTCDDLAVFLEDCV